MQKEDVSRPTKMYHKVPEIPLSFLGEPGWLESFWQRPDVCQKDVKHVMITETYFGDISGEKDAVGPNNRAE